YLVFDTDLLTAEHDGFSNILPAEVYYAGQKMHYNPFNPEDKSKEDSFFKGHPVPYFAMEEMWMEFMEAMWKEFYGEESDWHESH
ncbi:MAG: hypothetical protein IKS32_07815, partial [Solobacterium sp.]|nr:hypothetical protein [Solobacterium sp.]